LGHVPAYLYGPENVVAKFNGNWLCHVSSKMFRVSPMVQVLYPTKILQVGSSPYQVDGQ
jgi:hypothetical protein